ncbi:hypothetical protein RJ55_07404 [Drechmeria coniospora]|nr:hypothetical protein RJ55_07404 [Drechmeria coniospora]
MSMPFITTTAVHGLDDHLDDDAHDDACDGHLHRLRGRAALGGGPNGESRRRRSLAPGRFCFALSPEPVPCACCKCGVTAFCIVVVVVTNLASLAIVTPRLAPSTSPSAL